MEENYVEGTVGKRLPFYTTGAVFQWQLLLIQTPESNDSNGLIKWGFFAREEYT